MESSGNESSGPSSPQHPRWWKLFKNRGDKNPSTVSPGSSTKGGVFNVPLQESLASASVAISQVAPDNKARIYGHIPVVVAKTGLFLKENGTSSEGVFRKPGSEKRVRELELTFDAPPLYGKDLTWDKGYSVHDAATVLKRYLNSLPQPVVPFELYCAFQDALPRPETARSQLEIDSAVNSYKGLIAALPAPSQHLLFYLLDVLGVFARKSDVNRMTAVNLATTFQPGLLRHPPDMHGPPLTPAQSSLARRDGPAAAGPAQQPEADKAGLSTARIQAEQNEYKRSIEVIEFLILHQSAFELQLPKRVQSPPSPSAQGAPMATTGSAQSQRSQASQTAAMQTGSPKMSGSTALQPMPSRESEADYPTQPAAPRLSASQRATASPESSGRRTKASLGRRNSDRGAPSGPEHRRLRRKRQPMSNASGQQPATDGSLADNEPTVSASNVRRARTLPSGSLAPSARKQQATDATPAP